MRVATFILALGAAVALVSAMEMASADEEMLAMEMAPTDEEMLAEMASTDGEMPAEMASTDGEMPAEMCAPSYGDCSMSEENPCCNHEEHCKIAHWMEPKKSICLKKPPTCYNAFQRCAGAPNMEYVPYADCCEETHHCIKAEWAGWGKWCLPKPPKYYMAGQRCAGAPGKPYVPWATPACEHGYECVEAPEMGYGKFCKMAGDGTTTTTVAPTGTMGAHTETTVAPTGTMGAHTGTTAAPTGTMGAHTETTAAPTGTTKNCRRRRR